jgi:pimeloyl-ACP methyl ester carboxylesterase
MAIKRGYAGPPGAQLHYAESGSGPALLLLHSAPRSLRSFRKMLPLLAEHFRAIAVDLPGFGQSDPLPGPVTMEAIAQSMGQLLDALDIDRVHLFGYHTGNKVAAALAADDASRIDRLILCGQIHSIIPEKAKRDEAIRQIVQKYFERFPDSSDGDGLLRRWQADWSDLTGFAQPRQLFSQRSIRFEDIEALRVRVTDHLQALDHVADTYQANFAFDFEAALRRITVPALVVELVMPDEEHYGRQLTKVCALLANGQGSTIMNAGKVALESHAAELTDQILRFCGTSP